MENPWQELERGCAIPHAGCRAVFVSQRNAATSEHTTTSSTSTSSVPSDNKTASIASCETASSSTSPADDPSNTAGSKRKLFDVLNEFGPESATADYNDVDSDASSEDVVDDGNLEADAYGDVEGGSMVDGESRVSSLPSVHVPVPYSMTAQQVQASLPPSFPLPSAASLPTQRPPSSRPLLSLPPPKH